MGFSFVEKKLRVAIYLRLSDEDRDKVSKLERSESIKNQRNLLLEEIDKNSEFMLIGEYCDEDLSGAGTYRPQFERLINDCENGKIDVVLCKSQSRFSRDMEIVEKYIHNKFVEWNIRFIGLADNADTENSGNKKARQINGLVNEWYLEDISNNIRSAFRAKMKQGEFISPFASFGYEISSLDNNKLVVDSFASLVVKDIFNLYLKGMGFSIIAKHLNEKGIPSPSVYKYQKGSKLNVVSNRSREEIKWCSRTIKTILTNELYIGHLIQGKRTTISYKNHKVINKPKDMWIRRENIHEAIIDKEIFYKVQSAIKERTKVVKKTGTVHNFSGKVFCLVCGYCMRKKNSSRHNYLVCSNNHDGYDDCINKRSIRYDDLEDIVLKYINDKIDKFRDFDFIKKELSKNELDNFNRKIDVLIIQKCELEDRMAKIEKYLKNLYEDRVNNVIAVWQFEKLIKNYNLEEERLKEQLDFVDERINSYEIKKFRESIISNKYQKFERLNRVIVDEFIDKIYIGKINNDLNSRYIKIKWNFND